MFKQATAILLLSAPALLLSQPIIAMSVAEAQKQAEVKCVEGCVVLSPTEMAAVETSIQEAIQEAYQAGLKGWNKAASL